MKLYRFSPIQTETQLRDAATYIAEQITALCHKIIGEKLPITYLTICAHYEHEYQQLLTLLPELGEVQTANNGVRVTLRRPIAFEQQTIVDLRIRKPDPYRMQVGCGDFAARDYHAFKQTQLAQHPDSLRIIQRPAYEMIEFFDPDFDVLAYVVSD